MTKKEKAGAKKFGKLAAEVGAATILVPFALTGVFMLIWVNSRNVG